MWEGREGKGPREQVVVDYAWVEMGDAAMKHSGEEGGKDQRRGVTDDWESYIGWLVMGGGGTVGCDVYRH